MTSEMNTQIEIDLPESPDNNSPTSYHRPCFDQPEIPITRYTGSNPLDHQLFSLAGCVSTIGRIVARQQKITLRELTCKVESRQYFKNNNGSKSLVYPDSGGFTLVVNVDADMTQEQREKFIAEMEQHCMFPDTFSSLKYVIK
jgi:putative redox protein